MKRSSLGSKHGEFSIVVSHIASDIKAPRHAVGVTLGHCARQGIGGSGRTVVVLLAVVEVVESVVVLLREIELLVVRVALVVLVAEDEVVVVLVATVVLVTEVVKVLVVEDVLGHGAVVLVLVMLLEVLVVPVELVLLVALALVEVAVALVVLE